MDKGERARHELFSTQEDMRLMFFLCAETRALKEREERLQKRERFMVMAADVWKTELIPHWVPEMFCGFFSLLLFSLLLFKLLTSVERHTGNDQEKSGNCGNKAFLLQCAAKSGRWQSVRTCFFFFF